MDDDAYTCGDLREVDIIEQHQPEIETSSNEEDLGGDEDKEQEIPSITYHDARKVMTALRSFIETCDNVNDEVFQSLVNVEHVLERRRNMKQKHYSRLFQVVFKYILHIHNMLSLIHI